MSCQITEESYNKVFENEIFEGFAFLWQIENSKFKEHLLSNNMYEALHGREKSKNLKSYRVMGQNNFVDVLSIEEPVIEWLKTENL